MLHYLVVLLFVTLSCYIMIRHLVTLSCMLHYLIALSFVKLSLLIFLIILQSTVFAVFFLCLLTINKSFKDLFCYSFTLLQYQIYSFISKPRKISISISCTEKSSISTIIQCDCYWCSSKYHHGVVPNSYLGYGISALDGQHFCLTAGLVIWLQSATQSFPTPNPSLSAHPHRPPLNIMSCQGQTGEGEREHNCLLYTACRQADSLGRDTQKNT